MIPEKNSIEYYQNLHCTSYYNAGNLVTPKSGVSIQMLGLTESGMYGITSNAFEESDVLMLNIHINLIPFDKLMGSIKAVQLVGEMYKMEIEFMGMPNALFEKIKELLSVQRNEPLITASAEEIAVLEGLLAKLKS